MTNNAWNSNIPVELSKGGTNATSMATNTGILKYDGTRLVTSTTAKIDANNIYTNTSQPRFSAYRNGDVANVTGDNTAYSYICDVEYYDIGSNYDSGTGIFTAPVDGLYLFIAQAWTTGNPSTTFGTIQLVSTPVTLIHQEQRAAGTQNWNLMITRFISLAAGETCYPTVAIGASTKTSDLAGTNETMFLGCLIT